jgi:hypothetical protein
MALSQRCRLRGPVDHSVQHPQPGAGCSRQRVRRVVEKRRVDCGQVLADPLAPPWRVDWTKRWEGLAITLFQRDVAFGARPPVPTVGMTPVTSI